MFGPGGEAKATLPAVDAEGGAILQLDNTQTVCVENFTVDGVKVNGGKTDLRNAGLTVSGTGRILVGKRSGLVLILK